MSTTDSSSSRTTTTTTTSWERTRKNGGWLPVAAGAAGLAVLGLVNGLPMRSSVEKDLTSRSQQALATLGGNGLTVDFTGRDGVVKGTLPDGVSKEQVLQAVADVNGVRVVTFVPTDAGAASPSPTALPSSESPSAAALALPAVQSVATDGAVVLTGRVPSQAAADALVTAAGAVYGPDKVTNQLTVDAGVSDAGLTGFATLFGALGKDSAATASLADGTLTLSGSVAGADVQAAARAAAAAVTGDAAKVVDQLTVAAAPSPSPSPSPSPAATSGSAGSAAVQARLNALPLVLFPTASNSLTPQAQAVIKQAADILKANPAVKVRLDGHTDDLGSSRVNNELSAARAMTVRGYLIQLGVAADRLSYSYHGYADPKVANRDDAARAQNRRVTFTVL